jgi:hypothetical protein
MAARGIEIALIDARGNVFDVRPETEEAAVGPVVWRVNILNLLTKYKISSILLGCSLIILIEN